jgi:hypothetical protein
MPNHRQTIIDIQGEPSSRAKGARDDASLRVCFPGSPLWEMTDDDIRDGFNEEVLSGPVNDEGHTFGNHNRDYEDAPDLSTVETGGGGLPASPYVPNPVSPGEGLDAANQGSPPEGFGQTPSSTPGVGVGALENPATTSARQARHTLGDYVKGEGVGK